MSIRQRIVELVWVPAQELKPHPLNWRSHPPKQRQVLKALLEEIGYADALLARRLPDGSLQLIDGHLRAQLTPQEKVPVLVLDLDEQEANKLLATLDPVAAMAQADEEKLQQLLQGVQTQHQAIRQLLEELSGSESMVEPDSVPEVPVGQLYQILVECADEEEQRRLYERLREEGYQCRVLTL